MRPELTGKSPAITLKSVVLPAPLGPRIARRSPATISRSTSSTARKPPKRRPTPHTRRVGSVLRISSGASVKRLLDDALRDDTVLDDPDLALPRRLQLPTRRLSASRRRARLLEQAAEGLRHVRDEADDGQRRLAALVDDLERPLILDRLAVLVQVQDAAPRDLVAGPERARQAALKLCPKRTMRLVQALDQRPGRVVVVVDEAVGVVPAVQAREDLRDIPFVGPCRLRLQPRRRAEPSDVGSDEARSHLGEVPEEREEEVSDELLRIG